MIRNTADSPVPVLARPMSLQLNISKLRHQVCVVDALRYFYPNNFHGKSTVISLFVFREQSKSLAMQVHRQRRPQVQKRLGQGARHHTHQKGQSEAEEGRQKGDVERNHWCGSIERHQRWDICRHWRRRRQELFRFGPLWQPSQVLRAGLVEISARFDSGDSNESDGVRVRSDEQEDVDGAESGAESARRTRRPRLRALAVQLVFRCQRWARSNGVHFVIFLPEGGIQMEEGEEGVH